MRTRLCDPTAREALISSRCQGGAIVRVDDSVQAPGPRPGVLLGNSLVPVLGPAGRIRADVSVDANACTRRSLRARSPSTPVRRS
jgi:hypothetical protein